MGALALGNGVEDDGGEVGHEVRRLAAQGRQVPHRPSPAPRATANAHAPRAPRLLNLGGARPAPALLQPLGRVGGSCSAAEANGVAGGVASRGDERIWTRLVVGLDWIFGFLFFQLRRGVCPRRLAGSRDENRRNGRENL